MINNKREMNGEIVFAQDQTIEQKEGGYLAAGQGMGG
jgi:hypothetical protein